MGLDGLAQINLELSSRCDKSCTFCGHQNPAVNPGLVYGDMDFDLLICIAAQLPDSLTVQFHRDGEPLVYPRLGDALRLFEGRLRSLVTNGKQLLAKADEIVGQCEAVCVSAFAKDPDGPEQDAVLTAFLALPDRPPLPQVMVKVVGAIEPERRALWEALDLPVIHRRLHVPQQSRRYRGGDPPRPEHGVCLDLLHHPSIDWQGNLYLCNRLDPEGKARLGNLRDTSIEALWTGAPRMAWVRAHLTGQRDTVPACQGCEFFGIPNSD